MVAGFKPSEDRGILKTNTEAGQGEGGQENWPDAVSRSGRCMKEMNETKLTTNDERRCSRQRRDRKDRGKRDVRKKRKGKEKKIGATGSRSKAGYLERGRGVGLRNRTMELI
jgi:hypothetical protein